MKKRIVIAITVLVALNSYTVWRIIDRLAWLNHSSIVIALMTIALVCLQLTAPFGERLVFPKIQKTKATLRSILSLVWASYLSFGIVACLFLFSIVIDLMGFIIQLCNFNVSQEDLNNRLLFCLVSVSLITTLTGIYNARMTPVIQRIDVPLPSLPEAFIGFTIAQISDLHVGATIGLNFVEKTVAVVNSLHPDLIVVTGDLGDGKPEDLRPFLLPLEGLTSKHGCYYITGNHEYYWGAEGWMKEAARLGLKVLANQHEIITLSNEKIILAGVTDVSSVHFQGHDASDAAKALRGAPKNTVKILLAHQPISYIDAQAAGFDLQISGHTHGGQFFPFNLLIRFFQRYYKGLNHYKNMLIYVSTGTGYWGPPLRTGVRAQVSLLTLKTNETR